VALRHDPRPRHRGDDVSGEQKPSRESVRTQNRATALAWARGCQQWNDCWHECREAALDSILDGDLDEFDAAHATTGTYWRYTTGATT